MPATEAAATPGPVILVGPDGSRHPMAAAPVTSFAPPSSVTAGLSWILAPRVAATAGGGVVCIDGSLRAPPGGGRAGLALCVGALLRAGPRFPRTVPGDASDPFGFPRMVGEFCEWMGTRGLSEKTIDDRHKLLGYFAGWLLERGITRPAEVTKPVLDGYQRWLLHHRRPDGRLLTFRTVPLTGPRPGPGCSASSQVSARS